MARFVLVAPYDMATCAERLRAALGPGRAPLVATADERASWPAYGDVTGTLIAITRAPTTLLANTPKPTRLLAKMAPRNGGTEIRGTTHPPTWAVMFFLVWLVIAVTLLLHCLVPAMQDVFGELGHSSHRLTHDLIVTVLLPVAGFAMLLTVDERWRAQASDLIAFVRQTLDASELPADAGRFRRPRAPSVQTQH